jgi:hypothetical protein
MEEALDFIPLLKKHFSFLVNYGFKFTDSPNGFNIKNAIGVSDDSIEFIIGLDPRENVVDVYVRKKNDISNSKRFSLLQYLVERHNFRGGFPQVDFENLVEKQVAKYALLLRNNIEAILKDTKLG